MMTTTTKAARLKGDALDAYELVRIDLVRPAEGNRPPGDITELMASIAERGILQPLILTPVFDDPEKVHYRIVAGERRYRAAAELGQMTVPALIRERDRAGELVDRLVENVHRRNLEPLEEARAIQAIRDAEPRLSQEALAKRLGISQGQVSKRLALLELDEKLTPYIERGEVADDVVERLAALPPTSQAKVVRTASQWAGYYGHEGQENRSADLRRALGDVEKTRKADADRKARVRELKARGLKVLTGKAADEVRYDPETAAIGSGYGRLELRDEKDGKAKDHVSEPCHVVVLEAGGSARPVAYCTDPGRHKRGGDSKIRGTVSRSSGPTGPRETKEAREARLEREGIAKALEKRQEERQRYIRDVVIPTLTDDDALELVVLGIRTMDLDEEGYVDDAVRPDRIAELVGVPRRGRHTVKPGYFAGKLADVETARNGRARIAGALALSMLEDLIPPAFAFYQATRSTWAAFAPYFTWLEGRGYKPSEEERAQVAYDPKAKAKKTTRRRRSSGPGNRVAARASSG